MRRPPRWGWLGAGTVLALAVGAGFFVARQSPPSLMRSSACTGCSVLLITVDTLRSDRVGAFGGQGGLTPALDRLAQDGVRLTRAYSPAPLTLPSHASILTATSPPVHGIRANGLFRLGPNLPTLAAILKSAGYRTGAFVGAFVLDARFGLNRGFDVYDDRYGEPNPSNPDSAERRAEDVIKPALDWILARGSTSPVLSELALRQAQGERVKHRHERNRVTLVLSLSTCPTSSGDPGWNGTRCQPWFAWVHLSRSARSVSGARTLRVAARALRRRGRLRRCCGRDADRGSAGRRPARSNARDGHRGPR